MACFDSSGNLKYIGGIIDKEHRLLKLLRHIERTYGKVHLRELPNKEARKAVVKAILSSEHYFICIHVDYNWVVNQVYAIYPRIPKKNIRKYIKDALWLRIKYILEEKKVQLVYICKDLEWIFSNNIKYKIGELSMLADAIAWANLRMPKRIIRSKIEEIRFKEHLKKTVLSKIREKTDIRGTHQP